MNNEEKILSILEIIQEDVSQLKAGQAKLEAGQAKLEAGQARLEGDITQLKAGQAKLEGDISQLKAGQAKLEAGQKSIRKDIKDLSYHVHEGLFKGEIIRLDRRIDKLEELCAAK